INIRSLCIEFHILLGQLPDIANRLNHLLQVRFIFNTMLISRLGYEGYRTLRASAAQLRKHRSVNHGLWSAKRGIGLAQYSHSTHPVLQDNTRLCAKHIWIPKHKISYLTLLNRTDIIGYSVGNSRVNGIFSDILFGSVIIGMLAVAFHYAALLLHLVGHLPSPKRHLTNASHRLGVRTYDAEYAHILQDIFSGHSFSTNARVTTCNILRNRRI